MFQIFYCGTFGLEKSNKTKIGYGKFLKTITSQQHMEIYISKNWQYIQMII
jgi:hypothetical protein